MAERRTMQPADDRSALIRTGSTGSAENRTAFPVYQIRWYVLLLFSAGTMWQCNVFNTIGPIAESMKCAFGWTMVEIAIVPWIANIGYIVSAYAFSALLQSRGLRVGCLSFFGLVCGVGFCRVRVPGVWPTVFIYAGLALNGLAGPVACSAVTTLSAVFFPVEQRTTSTAIATLANGMGLATSFLLGPNVVVQRNCTSGNETADEAAKQLQLDDINRLFIVEAIVAGIIFVLALIYFPSKPPRPPSATAWQTRQAFCQSLRLVLTDRHLWLLGCVFGLSNGVYQSWLAVAVVLLEPLNVSQVDFGWMGFYSVLGSIGLGLVVSRLADWFPRRHKNFLLVLMGLSVGFSAVMVLLIEEVLSVSRVVLWVSFIGTGVVYMCSSPLFYELGCESSFPASETVVTSHLTLIQNAFGVIFLLFPAIFGRYSEKVMNWTLLVVTGCCFSVIFLYRPRYRRFSADEHAAVANSNRSPGLSSAVPVSSPKLPVYGSVNS